MMAVIMFNQLGRSGVKWFIHKTMPGNSVKKNDINDGKKKCLSLLEKKFMLRNSVLTDLPDDIPNITSDFYNFVGALFVLFIGTMVYDYIMFRQVQFGFSLIYAAFGKFHIAMYSWILFMLLTCGCYYCFTIWAQLRTNFKKENLRMWDSGWTIAMVGYFVFCIRLSSYIVSKYQLPPASASIVILEQIRLLMKLHAFVRTNAEKILQVEPHSDQCIMSPEFSQYIYFLFAPTLVFSFYYPRTKTLRWKFIIYRVLEIAGAIFYLSFLFGRFVIPSCADYGMRKFTWSEILLLVLKNCIIALPIYVTGFYLVFHSVLNLFAEILCFGDRLFYRDWWNCTTFSEYFKKWNIPVHDWLYTYLYKDIYERVVGDKGMAKTITFLVSAVVHEWALTYILGVFHPGLFTYFLAFLVLIILEEKQQNEQNVNFLFRLGLCIGSGILISSYALEYFAKINVSDSNSSLRNMLFPKFLTCDCIV